MHTQPQHSDSHKSHLTSGKWQTSMGKNIHTNTNTNDAISHTDLYAILYAIQMFVYPSLTYMNTIVRTLWLRRSMQCPCLYLRFLFWPDSLFLYGWYLIWVLVQHGASGEFGAFSIWHEALHTTQYIYHRHVKEQYSALWNIPYVEYCEKRNIFYIFSCLNLWADGLLFIIIFVWI